MGDGDSDGDAKDLGYLSEEIYSEREEKYEIVIKMLPNSSKSLDKKA
jgi:hypothetical protein